MEKLVKEIFSIYYKDVYLYLYSLSRDFHLSEDLAGEVFIEVLKSINSFKGQSDVKTWLFSIARHRWFNYLRKKKKSAEFELLSELIESSDGVPEEGICLEELKGRILKVLESCKEKERSVVLKRLHGFSFYEIAVDENINESSARVIFFRFKTKMKDILEKEGFYG